MRRWTKEEKIIALAMRRQGHTAGEIGPRIGRTEAAVRQFFSYTGTTTRQGRQPSIAEIKATHALEAETSP